MDQQRLSSALVEKQGCNKFYEVCKNNALKRINKKKLQFTKPGNNFLIKLYR